MNETLKAIILSITIIAWVIIFFKVYNDTRIRSKKQTSITKLLVRVAIFGAMSAILYIVPILKFPVPIFPSFLEFHFDEIPIFIAGFAYGPLTAIGVILVKTIIKLPFSGTLMVGEFADLVFSSAFVLPASFIYQKHRNFKGALVGILIGTVLQIVIAVVGNIYVMVPFYMFAYGMDADQLVRICQFANPNISDVGWSYGLLAVAPFNVIKDAIIVVVTLLVYKSMHRFIDKLQA